MIMIINITKPLIKWIDANALDIIDSLLAQSSLLLGFSQCLTILIMMMMVFDDNENVAFGMLTLYDDEF